MAKFKALARGTQLVLVAAPLLFFSLFFTWQNVEVDYGPAGIASMALDGFDAWGLLVALLTLVTVALVVMRAADVELSEEVPWPTIVLGLGTSILAVTLVKSLTDSGSTWESYAFVVFAGVVAVGTFLDWADARRAERTAARAQAPRRQLSRLTRSTRSSPGPS
jgi:hypothetical protein